jgi:hypothetical protein
MQLKVAKVVGSDALAATTLTTTQPQLVSFATRPQFMTTTHTSASYPALQGLSLTPILRPAKAALLASTT